eukprot:gb/GEZJ01004010.1/.p1 GENE.gb/GEZJ01004010.1/~~gb/GEZJ01004010.1/.p1  ORF type:complete len:105 (-),score=6.20 gb/GEZJ01004010.1/:86-400(-)
MSKVARGSHGVRAMDVDEAFPKCRDAAEALRTCARMHPQTSPTSVACERFAVLLGWCVSLSLCPAEARQLQYCCGGVPELVRCRRADCAAHHARLDRCMSRHTM